MERVLLVGDNPFHGVSHLTQARARERPAPLENCEHAADLVLAALRAGADGFMFTVSDVTLEILRRLSKNGSPARTHLWALVPDATQLVRMAARSGGLPGLGRTLALRVAALGGLGVLASALRGAVAADARALFKAYLLYELRRLRAAAPKSNRLVSILLHEVVTDAALALQIKWVFSEHWRLCTAHGIQPGFETRNFARLCETLADWGMGLPGLLIAAPFNPIGFQMTPSRGQCEKALADLPHGIDVIAFSVLAGGYVGVQDAVEYLVSLPKLRGLAVGISKREHVEMTIAPLRKALARDLATARAAP